MLVALLRWKSYYLRRRSRVRFWPIGKLTSPHRSLPLSWDCDPLCAPVAAANLDLGCGPAKTLGLRGSPDCPEAGPAGQWPGPLLGARGACTVAAGSERCGLPAVWYIFSVHISPQLGIFRWWQPSTTKWWTEWGSRPRNQPWLYLDFSKTSVDSRKIRPRSVAQKCFWSQTS